MHRCSPFLAVWHLLLLHARLLLTTLQPTQTPLQLLIAQLAAVRLKAAVQLKVAVRLLKAAVQLLKVAVLQKAAVQPLSAKLPKLHAFA